MEIGRKGQVVEGVFRRVLSDVGAGLVFIFVCT